MIAKVLGVIISVCLILGIFFGVLQYQDKTYAKNEKMAEVQRYAQKVGDRLDYKIMSDVLERKEQKIDELDKQYRGKTMPDAVKERYEELQKEKKALEKKVDKLEDKLGKEIQ